MGNQPARDDFPVTPRPPRPQRPERPPRRNPPGRSEPPQALRAGPAVRWLGRLSTRTAAVILAGATLLGVIGTLMTHGEPGTLLGLFVILGSVVAALAIRRGKLHLLIPLPALFLFFGAVIVGAVHDRGMDTSTTELGVNFLQWIASVFFTMCAATILVLVIAGGRWLVSRQLVSGQFPMSADRAGASRAPRSRPAPGAHPVARPRRDNRDPWGDSAAPADRDPLDSGNRRDMDDPWNPGNGRGARPQRGGNPSWPPVDSPGSPRNPRRPMY